jgi:uncharacterized membrane protein YkoI
MTFSKRAKTIVAGLVSAGLMGGAAAAAPQGGAAAEGGERAEIAAVLDAGRSLADAARTAEETGGGRAFEASLEDEDGALVWEISTLKGDALVEYAIDPASGEIVETEEEGFLSKLSRDDDEEAAALAAAGVGLTEAIAAAEAETGGRAMEAELEAEDQGPVWEVETASAEGGVVKVWVDAGSGAVLKTGAAEGDDD